MTKNNFIKTSDEYTKRQLIKCGFQLINENNGYFTFVNDSTLKFSEMLQKDKKLKFTYSNILCI